MLEINNLKKTFDNGTEALNGVNLKVKKGEFLSILGPSGSGKTTLLRSINGLESIDNGKISFENEKINKDNLPEIQKKTGMIFQEFNLVNNLSAINNVLTGLLNSSSKFLSMFYLFTKEQKLEALKALETVGLLNKAYERVDELSGGQRQRIGIARALYNNASTLIFDEATSALDGITEKKVMDAIYSLTGSKTIIVVAHRLASVKKCDAIYLLDDGKVIDSGVYDDLSSKNSLFKAMTDLA